MDVIATNARRTIHFAWTLPFRHFFHCSHPIIPHVSFSCPPSRFPFAGHGNLIKLIWLLRQMPTINYCIPHPAPSPISEWRQYWMAQWGIDDFINMLNKFTWCRPKCLKLVLSLLSFSHFVLGFGRIQRLMQSSHSFWTALSDSTFSFQTVIHPDLAHWKLILSWQTTVARE